MLDTIIDITTTYLTALGYNKHPYELIRNPKNPFLHFRVPDKNGPSTVAGVSATADGHLHLYELLFNSLGGHEHWIPLEDPKCFETLATILAKRPWGLFPDVRPLRDMALGVLAISTVENYSPSRVVL